MQTDQPIASNVSDDLVVARLFDLARQGETSSREFQLLDYVVQKRLGQTYGGDFVQATHAA